MQRFMLSPPAPTFAGEKVNPGIPWIPPPVVVAPVWPFRATALMPILPSPQGIIPLMLSPFTPITTNLLWNRYSGLIPGAIKQ